jgi:hypothetical protein
MGDQDWSYPNLSDYSTRLPEGSLVSLPGLNHLQALAASPWCIFRII